MIIGCESDTKFVCQKVGFVYLVFLLVCVSIWLLVRLTFLYHRCLAGGSYFIFWPLEIKCRKGVYLLFEVETSFRLSG